MWKAFFNFYLTASLSGAQSAHGSGCYSVFFSVFLACKAVIMEGNGQ